MRRNDHGVTNGIIIGLLALGARPRVSSRSATATRWWCRPRCFRSPRRRSPAPTPSPAGYTFFGKSLAIETPNFALVNLPADPVDNGTFALNAPVIAGRSNLLILSSESPGGGLAQLARRAVPPGTTGLAVEVPEAPEFIFPFDGSIGIDHDTMFLTTEFDEGVYLFQFSTTSPGPSFIVVTADPAANIPDLSVYGAGLPPSTSYFVNVVGLGRFADVEEFAGPTGPLPSPELVIASTSTINVTTAP